MIVDRRDNSIIFISDYRAKSDRELMENGHGDYHVFALNNRELADYRQYTRISLFEHGQKTTAQERATAKQELREYLRKCETSNVAIVIPTVSWEPDERSDTICWSAFDPPEGLAAMRSAFYQWESGRYVLPLFGFSPWLKELQRWQNDESIKRALRVASGESIVIQPRSTFVDIAPNSLTIKDVAREFKPPFIAADIESIEGSDIITAVGLSDGELNVSVPVDEYQPYGHDKREPGGTHEQLQALRDVLADESIPKVFHNHTFDVPRLEKRGFYVRGPIHDTFCAMAIAYPELAHGLQTSCAATFACPPWKSLWHPKLPGITREDVEFWICDPIGLREYNAKDAFYTWHLADEILPLVGVNL